MDAKEIGAFVRKRREGLGLTRARAAHDLGCAVYNIQDIERGRSGNIALFVAYCAYLGQWPTSHGTGGTRADISSIRIGQIMRALPTAVPYGLIEDLARAELDDDEGDDDR